MSCTNGIGNSQNPFAAETSASSATSGPAQTECTTSISLPGQVASGAPGQALSQSDVRMEKITALQQTIANGTYNVSADDVADKIINSLLPQL